MLPRDRFVTTSSRSGTSSRESSRRGRFRPKSRAPQAKAFTAAPVERSAGTGIDTPVQFIKGVGPRLGGVFAARDIRTVRDVLTFFPRAYEDRSKLLTVAELAEGLQASVAVQVESARVIPIRGRHHRSILEVRCHDASGPMSLKWFHVYRGLVERFKPGTQIVVTGTVKRFQGRPEIVHPEIAWGLSSAADVKEAGGPSVGRVVPVYTEIEGIPSRVLRKVLWEAVEQYCPMLTEDIPERLLRTHGLPAVSQAIRDIHFPPTPDEGNPATLEETLRSLVAFDTVAHRRMIYEEFFKFEYLVLRQRLRAEKQHAVPIGARGGLEALKTLEKALPFKLTKDQRAAVDEVLKDLALPHPMNRLIQGDVGSGKTAVAFLTVGAALAEGAQAALMAPTEILAEQHFRTAIGLFGGQLRVALLTGKTSASERVTLLARLAAGEPLLLIGTHALIEDVVQFRSLRYVLIDEQHRFGVEQRRALRLKGAKLDPASGNRVLPHSLILTATPIPRTLALTAYGDLTVTSIREMPPGRTPVVTRVVRGDPSAAYDRIRAELKAGRQAYFIYPLVTDSQAEGFTELKSAVAEAERLQKEVFTEFQVALLHGQMRPDEKSAVMDRFKRGQAHVLVSTTVVEVGVDVPNATVIAVEHAERFGLSQLHQLRGRVGRGAAKSYCFLFAPPRGGEATEARLEVLEETTDGFKIAEADLEIRGPGEFLGTRQAGGLPFRIGNIVRDRGWLLKARDDAQTLLDEDPDLEKAEHAPLRRYFEREGKLQFERLKTS